MIMSNVLIQVVSLPDDEERRSHLEKRFPLAFKRFEVVDAIDYRSKLLSGFSQSERKSGMTPAEIGCTLSHIKALNIFLASDYLFSLILEDDVIGSDESIDMVDNIANLNKIEGFFVLCGGQDGMRNRNYIYGHPSNGIGVFRVSFWSRSFMARTCCYLVNRSAARYILDRHKIRLSRADNWEYLLKGYNDVFYTGIFSHPVDLSGSHIEVQRVENKAGVISVIVRDGFFRTIYRNTCKMVLKLFGRRLGLRPLLPLELT